MTKLSDFLVGGAGGATQVRVRATDAFTAGDLAFADYNAAEMLNLKSMLSQIAFTAGSASQAFNSGIASMTACATQVLDLADGSFVVIAAGFGGAQYNLTATRYSQRGKLMAKAIIVAPQASTIQNMIATVLTNGNIAFGWRLGGASGKWAILSPNMALVATGTTTATVQHYIQEVTGGGFFIVHATGHDLVSATGVLTNVATYNITGTAGYGVSSVLSDDQRLRHNTRCPLQSNFALIPLSAGGYGLVAAGNTGINYMQWNADGTVRGVLIALNAWGALSPSSVTWARNAAGNICWLGTSNAASSWGVVADNGAIVLAAASAAGWTEANGLARTYVDAADCFLMIGTTAGNTALTINYVSGVGVAKATYPKLLSAVSGPNSVFDWFAVPLTTGTVVVHQSSTLYNFTYEFITLAGAFTTGLPLYNFTAAGGTQLTGAFVFNDKVYGAVSAGAGGIADLAVFTITNANALEVVPVTTGVSFAASNVLGMVLDTTQTTFTVVGLTGTSAALAVTFAVADKSFVQQLAVNGGLTGAGNGATGKLKAIPGGLLAFDPSTGAAPAGAVYTKVRPTVLLGVAATTVAAGANMIVNTQGLYATNNPASQLYDHSGNTPKGNKGSITNGVISLAGL